MSLRTLFRRPLLLLPVFIQLSLLYGVLFMGLILCTAYIKLTAVNANAFSLFIEALLYMLTLGTGVQIDAPQAYADAGSLAQALGPGFWSVQSFGLALLVALFVFVGITVGSYTKSLVLGVMADAAEGKPSSIITMFRAGREYWAPVLRYYIPFAVLGVLALFTYFWMLVYWGYSLLSTGDVPHAPPAVWLFVVLILVITVLRLATITVEAMITDGSRKPILDSTRFGRQHFGATVVTAGALVIVCFAVFMLNALLNRAAVWLPFAEVVALLVLIAWRLWATGFVVALWRGKTRARTAPPS